MASIENAVRRHRRRPALLVVALAMMCALLAAPGTAQGASGDYIVVLRPGVSLQAHLKAMKITPKRVYSYAATGYAATLNDTHYKRVLASSDVTILTPDAVIASLPFVPAKQDEPTQPPQGFTPAISRIGTLTSPTAAIDGIDTRIDADVAVVDTGVDATHPDLNVVGGTDCTGKNTSEGLVDKYGHGTMVAGLVGALDNAIGRVGVAPGARIWSAQVMNNGGVVTEGAFLCAIDGSPPMPLRSRSQT